jgi:hypothetical protein
MNEIQKQMLNRLAKKLGCEPDVAKEFFLFGLMKIDIGPLDFNDVFNDLNERKPEEALLYEVYPDETMASICEKWAKEYFEERLYLFRVRTVDQVKEDIYFENPFLFELFLKDDKEGMKIFLKNNSQILDKLVSESNKRAQYPIDSIRMWATDKFYTKNDHLSAIRILNIGLKLNNKDDNISLLNLRFQCYRENMEYDLAIKDLLEVIVNLELNYPQNKMTLVNFHIDLFDVYILMEDYKNAEKSINNAISILENIEDDEKMFTLYICYKNRSTLNLKIGNLIAAEEDMQQARTFRDMKKRS